MKLGLKTGAPAARVGAPVVFSHGIAAWGRAASLAPPCAALMAAWLVAGSPALAVGGSGEPIVRSLRELRQANVVRQQWDLSCGAAALSTLLTYHLDAPVSEAEIIRDILRRSDPVRIRAREGFSLLDLKRFANARGHAAEGYGNLKLRHLQRMAPALVPTRIGGYNHFVIFLGRVDDRVLLADPAFGNRTMPAERFMALWPLRIAFVVGSDLRRRSPLTDGELAAAPFVPDRVVRHAIGRLR
jgi:predicted double-glycine peptidase